MRTTHTALRRVAGILALSVTAFGLIACSDDDVDDEPEIQQIRLVIGTQTFTSIGGNPPTGSVVIPRGAHPVTVTALTASGGVITLDSREFELRITSSNTAVANYTKASAFSGILAASAAGTTTLNVQLYHLVEMHADYTLASMAITVQ
jgi:hypothetical protein